MSDKEKLIAIRDMLVKLIDDYDQSDMVKAGWMGTIMLINVCIESVYYSRWGHKCDNDGQGCSVCSDLEDLIPDIIKLYEHLI